MFTRISSPTLVGRRDERASLADALERARTEGTRMVTVSGEAGIGKTRLAAALADHARTAGFRVLSGGCLDIADGVLPLGAISEAMRPLWTELDPATLGAVVGPAGPDLARLGLMGADAESGVAAGGPGQVLEQVRGVLDRLAALSPVLLVIEDVHWAERSTRDLLPYLIRNVGQPLLIVATYRVEEVRHRHELRTLLAELHRNRRCDHLALGPLTRADVAEMLGEIVGFAAPMELVDEIAGRSEGNPFFAEELLAAHRRGAELPGTLRTVLAARIDRLPRSSAPLLGLLATFGGPAAHDLLAALFGSDDDTLIDLLRVAVDEDVLRVSGDGQSYTFRHALLRELVYAELLPGERLQFHERCGRVLAERPPRPAPAERAAQLGAVAFHWHRAGDAPQALLWSARAGVAAEAAASPADATRHYQRMLDLWNQVSDPADRCGIDRDTLLRRAAGTAHLAGDYPAAIQLLTDALESVDSSRNPLCSSEFFESIGYCQLASGDLDSAERAYDAAARAARAYLSTRPDGLETPCAELVRALTGQAHVLLIRDRNALAAEAARAALAIAERLDDRVLVCRPLTVLGSAQCNLGLVAQGLSTLERAATASEAGGDPSTLIWALGAIADARLLAGQAAAAIPPARRALAVARSLGAAGNYGAWFATAAGEALLWLGDFPSAVTELEALLALDPPTGVRRRPQVALAHVYLARGSHVPARAAADVALAASVEQFSAALFADACALLARIATSEGRFDDASRAVADGLAGRAGADGATGVIRLCCAALAAEAERHGLAATLGIADDAVAQSAQGWIRLARGAGGTAEMLLPMAELATAEAEFSRITATPQEQAESWQAATSRWDELGFVHPATYSRFRRAQALLAAGAADEAAIALRVARADSLRIGAAGLAGQVGELARRARIDLPAATSDGPDVGQGRAPGGLTDRERQVLELLVEGRTNRSIAQALFISEKTVSVHVTHILAKLHVSNRGEAAAAGRRSDPAPNGGGHVPVGQPSTTRRSTAISRG